MILFAKKSQNNVNLFARIKKKKEKCGKICIYQKNIVILPRFFIIIINKLYQSYERSN